MPDLEEKLSTALSSQRHDAAVALLEAVQHSATSAVHAGSGPATVPYAAAAKDFAEAFARIFGR